MSETQEEIVTLTFENAANERQTWKIASETGDLLRDYVGRAAKQMFQPVPQRVGISTKDGAIIQNWSDKTVRAIIDSYHTNHFVIGTPDQLGESTTSALDSDTQTVVSYLSEYDTLNIFNFKKIALRTKLPESKVITILQKLFETGQLQVSGLEGKYLGALSIDDLTKYVDDKKISIIKYLSCIALFLLIYGSFSIMLFLLGNPILLSVTVFLMTSIPITILLFLLLVDVRHNKKFAECLIRLKTT